MHKPNKTLYIGIDPGQTGAIAIINNTVHITSFNPKDLTPFINTLQKITNNPYKLYIEHAHSKPGDGHKGAFTFGKNYGIILGILATLNITPTCFIEPNRWKKALNLIKKDKQASINTAKKLYPEINLKRTKRCTTDDHNMAEALLIAHYCKINEKNKTI